MALCLSLPSSFSSVFISSAPPLHINHRTRAAVQREPYAQARPRAATCLSGA